MSHFSAIKTEMKHLGVVEAALRRLGVDHVRGGAIEDYYGNRREVDLVAHPPDQRPVGFVYNSASGVYELVGDWYGGQTSQEDFLLSLKCNYAREQVLESLEQQGVDLSRVKEWEEPDGSVVFELPLRDDEMESLLTG